ncbi:tetratricopeptide repeat protein [Gimesia algae]|uniref:Tetratricopeptide repeat protein n=1 Tax=Gimesia algae TaxID=2527971 RepID=A0A517VL28_9PLAN|nr:tetratricopeptide repeat protein [Gimesia algae]QDT93724.1 Tetratricopeptide repeat protein [Gimesia algae]
MIQLIRLLLILLVAELGYCGYLIAERLARPIPVLPEAKYIDPLLMADYRELAAEAESGSSREWIRLGQAFLGQGFYGYAENCFRQAARIDPDDALAQASYAFCLERTGRMQVSTREYEKLEAYSAKTDTPFASPRHYLYAIGRNYLREENVEKAEEIFRKNNGFPPADYQLAKLLVRSGRAEEALPYIERNLAATPYSLIFNQLQAQALESLGRLAEAKQAEDRLERAMYQIPLNFNTDFLTPYSKRHGIQKEVEAYNQLLERNDMDHLAKKLDEVLELMSERRIPQYKATLISMLEVEFQRKNPERMLKLIQKLKEFGVENAETLQFEAGAYLLSGDMEKAVPLLQRVLEMSPTIEVHQTLADYYDQQKNTEKRDYHQAKIALLFAMINFRNNQLKPAEEAIVRSVELNPLDPQTWFYYAEIKRVLGDQASAKEAYQKCLKLNPNHGRASRELALLNQS